MAPPATHLAWVDLETTGTDERRDFIIEVGFILTDIDLNVLHQNTWVVEPAAPRTVVFNSMSPFVKEMHEANGLLDALRSDQGVPLLFVERDLIDALNANMVESHAVMLAGSGVGHFDLRFVKAQMQEFAKCLAYPVIDVGVMRRFIRDVAGREDLVPRDGDSATKSHRAQDDIRQHLNEARSYKLAIAGITKGDFWG